ncbi:hypothetical protein ACQ4M4_01265 [Leptolyngbya sp. AN02str]|uniref:hypothetical protein n=1 Tax=Leptolyngbya sp. AN02str TaxID=3423363 RepID=UPI003D323A99
MSHAKRIVKQQERSLWNLMRPMLCDRRIWRIMVPMIVSGIVVLLTMVPALAQSSGLDGRVSRLESENSQLRARVNQLESQVSRLGRSPASRTPQTPPPVVRGTEGSALAEDPVFQRLATLVIELRERIVALEQTQ